MNKMVNRALIVISIILSAAALILADTQEYRLALEKVSTREVLGWVATESKRISDDVDRYTKCSAIGRVIPDKEKRECLLAGMQQVTTHVGAIAFSASARQWLHEHPLDNAVQLAALKSIEAGWHALYQGKNTQDLFEAVQIAHDKSILLKLLQGHARGSSHESLWIEQLKKAEYAVRMPSVSQKLTERELRLMTGKNPF